jgi:imidazolonepropionase-like amidohydrolase
VVIEDGRIRAVGPAAEVRVPTGALRLSAAVATPGFVDAHTNAGLAGAGNVPSVLDQDELSDPNGADLRALDAFDPADPMLRWLLEHGTTVVQASPGPGNPIAGQAGIFRTHGRSADAMVVRFPSAVVFNLGESPKLAYGAERKAPMTRMGTAAIVRRALAEAKRESGWLGGEPEDPRSAVLARVARGELPAIFTAQRADDLLTALRIAKEFELRFALAGAAEGWLVADALAAAQASVLAGPVMMRPALPETQNASFENAAILAARGVRIAIPSGFEAYVPKNHVVLFEATVAAAFGLGRDAALRAITLEPARLLGIDADYGSLEPGKRADVVLFDGEPLEYTTHVTAVVASGEVVYER